MKNLNCPTANTYLITLRTLRQLTLMYCCIEYILGIIVVNVDKWALTWKIVALNWQFLFNELDKLKDSIQN